MDLLEEMLKKSYEKVDKGNQNWCGTPTASGSAKKMVRSVRAGKGKYDFLLGPISQQDDDDELSRYLKNSGL